MDKILILGVTASGKGALAYELARESGAEIISVDSMKVYRRMDIGTAKPSAERREKVKYHLIDVVEPSESFSVDKFLELAEKARKQTISAGKPVIAVGGTAMYIKAMLFGLFEGPGSDEAVRAKLRAQVKEMGTDPLHGKLLEIDPEAAERIHPNDKKRIIRALEVYEITGKPISSLQKQWEKENPQHEWTILGLRREKQDASSRINQRVKKMVEEGLVDEVKSLLDEEKPLSRQAACAIGYAEIIEHLEGKVKLEKAIENIKINTRKFAKSQRTWFRTFSDVKWIDIDQEDGNDSIFNKARELVDI